jgi:hypothetical protein
MQHHMLLKWCKPFSSAVKRKRNSSKVEPLEIYSSGDDDGIHV